MLRIIRELYMFSRKFWVYSCIYSVSLSSSQDCVSVGCGEPNVSEHCSFVLYHNNSPRWSENLKLVIPIERFRGSHLRFEFRHCSSEYCVSAPQTLSIYSEKLINSAIFPQSHCSTHPLFSRISVWSSHHILHWMTALYQVWIFLWLPFI